MRRYRAAVLLMMMTGMCMTSVRGAEDPSMSGYVTDEEDTPIEAACFTLYQYGTPIQDAICTNEKGYWELKDLPEGAYQLQQTTSAYGYVADTQTVTITIPNPSQTIITKNPKMLGDVALHITEEEDIVKHLSMQVQTEEGEVVFQGNSDEHGDLQIKSLPLGSYRLRVRNSRYEEQDQLRFHVTTANYDHEQRIQFTLHKKAGYRQSMQPAVIVFFLWIIGIGVFVLWYIRHHDPEALRRDFM